MDYSKLFSVIEIAILLTSAFFFKMSADYFKATPKIRFKKDRFSAVTDYVKNALYKQEMEMLFTQSGFKISGVKYQIIRYSIFIPWFLYLVYCRFYIASISRNDVLFMLFAFFVTSPRTNINGLLTPFHYFLDFFAFEHRIRKNKEIYSALLQLKNLSIAKAGEDIGSIYIIEELAKYTRVTKPIFFKFLSMWFENRKEEACSYFAEAIDTKEGRNLADIFLKLDSLRPDELYSQLLLYQEGFDEERKTKFEARSERVSTWFFVIATFSVFIVMMNFLTIVLWIDTINTYRTIYVH